MRTARYRGWGPDREGRHSPAFDIELRGLVSAQTKAKELENEGLEYAGPGLFELTMPGCLDRHAEAKADTPSSHVVIAPKGA